MFHFGQNKGVHFQPWGLIWSFGGPVVGGFAADTAWGVIWTWFQVNQKTIRTERSQGSTNFDRKYWYGSPYRLHKFVIFKMLGWTISLVGRQGLWLVLFYGFNFWRFLYWLWSWLTPGLGRDLFALVWWMRSLVTGCSLKGFPSVQKKGGWNNIHMISHHHNSSILQHEGGFSHSGSPCNR